jgi:hypothetical protein
MLNRSTLGRALAAVSAVALLSALPLSGAGAADAGMKQWTKGKGWGWVWGPDDEVGALNEMTDQSRMAAVGLVRQGKAYDLGLPYDRMSYKWAGHSPGEIISFRTPEGVARQKDLPFTTPEGGNTGATRWHSNALFMNDNVATQLDGLGHITHGEDNHWYNGFKEADWGGNFGIRKTDVTTDPAGDRPGRDARHSGPQGRRGACRRATRSPSRTWTPRCAPRTSTSPPARWCWSAPARPATGVRTAPTTRRSASTTPPASAWRRRSTSSSRRGP